MCKISTTFFRYKQNLSHFMQTVLKNETKTNLKELFLSQLLRPKCSEPVTNRHTTHPQLLQNFELYWLYKKFNSERRGNFGGISLRNKNSLSQETPTRRARWNLPCICPIYFTAQSGQEPPKTFWAGKTLKVRVASDPLKSRIVPYVMLSMLSMLPSI